MICTVGNSRAGLGGQKGVGILNGLDKIDLIKKGDVCVKF